VFALAGQEDDRCERQSDQLRALGAFTSWS
jgi:hypothetical protein